jgi:NCAIR mutase (PurE)-related protein
VRVDPGREQRTGIPEMVYAGGKTPEQCLRAVLALLERSSGPVLATRAEPEHAGPVLDAVPGAAYDEVGRVVVARTAPAGAARAGCVAVACAGTSDLPVARECVTVLEAFGLAPALIADVGVAGLHRLLDVRDRLDAADVVIAIAGMEGALPTVVNGLVSPPVIAVPTSVGYGVSIDGASALIGMLSSCTPGLMVVNIDNGVGAAVAALKILRARAR